MSKSARTVRFDEKDIKRIDEFLRENSFLDFSSLTRLALDQFIKNPSVQIKGISPASGSTKKSGQNVTN